MNFRVHLSSRYLTDTCHRRPVRRVNDGFEQPAQISKYAKDAYKSSFVVKPTTFLIEYV